ncbi:hypothetical protein [Brevibacterium samyangense]|uniref:Glycosyltransferase n=1 Tax=Brevibacterium samyangense TaxID=366888 RepID=A0ABP5F4T0_9MICO
MDELQFDVDFYTDWYPALSHLNAEELSAEWHERGRAAGRFGTFQEMLRANGLDEGDLPIDFDWRTYLELNDKLPSTWNRWQAMRHYLEHGIRESRPYKVNPVARRRAEEVRAILALDTEWYADVYGLGSSTNPSEHYEKFGRPNLLAPNPSFSPVAYWSKNPDVAEGRIDPVEHFSKSGYLENRPTAPVDVDHERRRSYYRPSALSGARDFFAYDEDFYYLQRPDIARARKKVVAFDHYNGSGESEGTRPSRFFDPTFYSKKYAASLEGWTKTALAHFLSVGLVNGFMPSAEVADGARRAGARSAVEWVGHWTGRTTFAPVSRVSPPRKSATFESSLPANPVSGTARRRVLNWVIPAFSKGGGGHTTIFRCARTLSRLGWKSVFWIFGDTDAAKIDDLYAQFIGHFPVSPVEFRRVGDGFHDVEDEFLIASSWPTAYEVQKNTRNNARLYFVQDRESQFDAAGTRAMQAEWTYHMGFDYVCAGPWLEDMVADTGGLHTSFELCAEPAFSRQDPPLADRDVLAAIYVRGHSPRRATDLMVRVANELAASGMGEVVIFGDDNPPFEVSPQVVNAGVLSPNEMAELFHRTRFGLAASATNYSILPVELAASGTVVVQPYSGSTQDTTDAHGAYSVQPDVDAVVSFILEAATDLVQNDFDELRRPYMDFARSISWEHEFEKVASWLEEHKLAGDAPVVPREKVAVVIPTYYPTEKLHQIVERVHAQRTSFDVILQIVDTRRNGEVSGVITEIEKDPRNQVHPIDSSDFQHGATRTFGARLVPEADYYAYLTDDATPANEYWLESLVSPMAMLPDCAYTFGRHRAYPDHHPLYDQELIQHFNGFESLGFLASRRMYPQRFEREPWFRAALSFNSDNNAGYRGDVMKKYGFPAVPFAEDQAFAQQLLVLGYSRAFASSAVVNHSHDYTKTPEIAYKRGTEEANALYQNFKLVQHRTARDVVNAKRATEQMTVNMAVRLGLSEESIAEFLTSKFAYIDGAYKAGQKYLETPKSGNQIA